MEMNLFKRFVEKFKREGGEDIFGGGKKLIYMPLPTNTEGQTSAFSRRLYNQLLTLGLMQSKEEGAEYTADNLLKIKVPYQVEETSLTVDIADAKFRHDMHDFYTWNSPDPDVHLATLKIYVKKYSSTAPTATNGTAIDPTDNTNPWYGATEADYTSEDPIEITLSDSSVGFAIVILRTDDLPVAYGAYAFETD